MKNLFTIILFAITTFLFVGCSSHPKENDWYEHKGTKERLQVSQIGTGKDLDNIYSDIVISTNKLIKDNNMTITRPTLYHYNPADSLKECVSFQRTIKKIYSIQDQIDIISVEKLKQDYTYVE